MSAVEALWKAATMKSRIQIAGEDHGLDLICSGYLVSGDSVLLVYHNRFRLWVPPGGHLEPDETFAGTVEREFGEETGLAVEVLSAAPVIHPPDSNATPTPVPFYADVEVEGFARPALVQFYFVRQRHPDQVPTPQLSEVDEVRRFSAKELEEIETFEQVRSLAHYALRHHPDANR